MIQSGYTKLFGSIVASTIWREDDKTRLVWITLLALSDRDGYVAASLPGLADLARVSVEDCEKSMVKLQQPDKYSRSSEHDGRRIQAIEGGWLILNRAKYRDLVPDEHRREVDRRRQQRHRLKQKDSDVSLSRVTDRDSHEMSLKEKKEKEVKNKTPTGAVASVTGDTDHTDPRHARVRQLIQELHLQKFRVKCQWDGSEAKALDRLLSGNPSWSQEEIAQMVRNRFLSEGIASDRPRKWLLNLGSYAAGPQDRYNRLKGPRGGGNGDNHRPRDQQFVGVSPEFAPCPFGECDGSTWYVEMETRARRECRCAQVSKTTLGDLGELAVGDAGTASKRPSTTNNQMCDAAALKIGP